MLPIHGVLSVRKLVIVHDEVILNIFVIPSPSNMYTYSAVQDGAQL